MNDIKNVWIDGNVITSSKLNNIRNWIKSTNMYDIVFVCHGNPFDDPMPNVGDFEVVSGSLEECEQKLASGKPVNAILVTMFNYGGSVINTSHMYTCVWYDLAYKSYIFVNSCISDSHKKKCTIFYDSSYKLTAVQWNSLNLYDADIFWDYENRTGYINYGTYSNIASIINDGREPQINVTIQYNKNNTYKGLALGIEFLYGEDNIVLYAGSTLNDLFTWSPNNRIAYMYPNN